jgi:hypothetical protein
MSEKIGIEELVTPKRLFGMLSMLEDLHRELKWASLGVAMLNGVGVFVVEWYVVPFAVVVSACFYAKSRKHADLENTFRQGAVEFREGQ